MFTVIYLLTGTAVMGSFGSVADAIAYIAGQVDPWNFMVAPVFSPPSSPGAGSASTGAIKAGNIVVLMFTAFGGVPGAIVFSSFPDTKTANLWCAAYNTTNPFWVLTAQGA